MKDFVVSNVSVSERPPGNLTQHEGFRYVECVRSQKRPLAI